MPLTRKVLADVERIAAVVGDPPDRRWHRGRLSAHGRDGICRGDWLDQVPAEDRIEQVRAFLSSGRWSPLLVAPVRKSDGGHRDIIVQNTVEQAGAYVLYDALESLVSNKLSKVALGYVRGKTLRGAIVGGIELAREHSCCLTPDVHHFFDELGWGHLERQLRSLPIHENLVEWLMQLVQVPFVRRDGRLHTRSKGIGQGLVIAPLLANLYMADSDQRLSRRLANLGVPVRRWSDNYLMPAPSPKAAKQALEVLDEELARIGLKLKPATRTLHDLNNPRNAPTWLGISFDRDRAWVAPEAIEKKADELRELLESGEIDESQLDQRLESRKRYYEAIVGRSEVERATERIRRRLAHTITGIRTTKEVESTTARCSTSPRWTKSNPGQPGRRGARDSGVTLDDGKQSSLGSTTYTHLQSKPHKIPVPTGDEDGRQGHPPREDVTVSSLSLGGGHHQSSSLAVVPCGGLPPAVDPASDHRQCGPYKSTREARAWIEGCWRLELTPQGPHQVLARAVCEWTGERWEHTYTLPTSRSVTEVAIAGTTLALRQLWDRGAGAVEVVVSDRTLVGYLDRGWRIRSPALWSRIRELKTEIHGKRLTFVLPNGRLGGWPPAL